MFISRYLFRIFAFLQCICLRWGLGKKPSKLIKRLLKLTSQGAALPGDKEMHKSIEYQIKNLLHEYGIAEGSSYESETLVRGLSKRHGQSAIDFLLRSYGASTSKRLAQQSRSSSDQINEQLLYFITILYAVVEHWPQQARFRRMLALALCFGHVSWGGACEMALLQWHWAAGQPDWPVLLGRVTDEEGVESVALKSFLFERLWLDTGAFELFSNISGGGPSRMWGEGLLSDVVKNVKRTIRDDWTWYKKNIRLSLPLKRFQTYELEDRSSWNDAGVSIAKGRVPKSACAQWLKYLRALGNTSFSGLRYDRDAQEPAEIHIHEPLFRVAWALDPKKYEIASMLREILISARWPSLLNDQMHIQELGFFDIHKGAAAQGFHRDTYKDSAVHIQLSLTESGECAPIELVPGTHTVDEATLCSKCPEQKDVQGRRLRALFPHKAVRLSALDIGDLVLYDPRVYHRGSSCEEGKYILPRAVLWISLATSDSASNALERASDLPHNPYLQALWKSGKIFRVADLLETSPASEL